MGKAIDEREESAQSWMGPWEGCAKTRQEWSVEYWCNHLQTTSETESVGLLVGSWKRSSRDERSGEECQSDLVDGKHVVKVGCSVKTGRVEKSVSVDNRKED